MMIGIFLSAMTAFEDVLTGIEGDAKRKSDWDEFEKSMDDMMENWVKRMEKMK